MAVPFLSNIKIDKAGYVQFVTTAGTNAGKIDQDGNDLVLTNPVGDILLGDGNADVYIGDGINSVDILFEQSGSIKADAASSGVVLTLGSSNTTLNLTTPNIVGALYDTSSSAGTSGQILSSTGSAVQWVSSAPNSQLLDNLDSTQFLRSDTADTATGLIFFDGSFEAHPIMLSGAQNFDNIDRSGFYNLYNTHTGSTNSPGFPYGTMIVIGNDKTSGFGLQIAHERQNTGMYVRGMNDTGSTWSSWAEIWTSATDGSGSGLDADLLDGQHGSYYLSTTGTAADSQLLDGLDSTQFLRSDVDDTTTGKITFAKAASGTLASRTGWNDFLGYNTSYGSYIGGGDGNTSKYLYAGGYFYDGTTHRTLWHTGNDGSGSGLDADLLDGNHASAFALSSHTHDDRYYTETEADARFVNVTGDTMTGNLTISNTGPVLILNDTNSTGTTDQTGFISFKNQNAETGWIGFGSSGNSDFTVKNTSGNVVLNASSDVVISNGNLSLNGTGRIQGVDTVSASTDAANKAYVDAHTYSHNHDDRYYTETETNNFFSGATAITGYNKTNWDTAYNNSIVSATVTGTTTKTLTLNQQDGGTVQASWSDDTGSNNYVTSATFGTGDGILTLNRSGLSAVTVDLDNRYAYLDHIRSLGTTAFNSGASGSITTAQLISEIETDGGFDSYSSVFKTSWSYAGNDDLSDAGRFTETAGTSWITWTDNSSDTTRGNITALAIAPNTGGSAGKVFIYNDQGSSYSPGWREVWTSTSDGAGSGLDADLLDGQQGSYYAAASSLSSYLPLAGGTMTGNIAMSNYNITGVNQLEINDPGEGIIWKGGSSGDITLAVVDDTSDNILRLSGTNAELQVGTNRVLTTADEGSGNGLDADTLDGQHGSYYLAWGNLTGVPSTFAPSAHTLDSHSNVTITSNTSGEILKWNGSAWVNNTLAEAGIAAASHTHDDRYYTETETNNFFSGTTAITGYNKTNWDAAYTYSQVGHLPLTGGTLSGDLTVNGGDIILGGTGRIQGVDTVSANTDAANKLYVDNAIAGVSGGGDVWGDSGSTTGNYLTKWTTPAAGHTYEITQSQIYDNGTNIGIGNSVTSTKLNVWNSHYLRSNITNTSQTNILIQGSGYHTGTTLYGNTSIRSTYNNSSNAAGLEFYVASGGTSTGEAMRIASNGNVGIGTTTPGSELEVDGETTTTNLSYPYPTATGQYHGEIVTFGTFYTTNGTIAAGDVIVYTQAGVNTGWFRATGNTTYGKGMFGLAMGSTPSAGILIKGFARNAVFTATVAGSPLYISASSAGDTTSTPPSSTNNIVRIVGYMLNPTNDEIFFDPDKSWVQVS